jgi:hypothetical protein
VRTGDGAAIYRAALFLLKAVVSAVLCPKKLKSSQGSTARSASAAILNWADGGVDPLEHHQAREVRAGFATALSTAAGRSGTRSGLRGTPERAAPQGTLISVAWGEQAMSRALSARVVPLPQRRLA